MRYLIAIAVLFVVSACASVPVPQQAIPQQAEGPSKVFRATSQPANAPMVLRIFTEDPCTDAATITHLKRMGAGDMLDQFKAARLMWEGKDYAGCWTEQQGFVVAVYEDGSDIGAIPMRLFRDETL